MRIFLTGATGYIGLAVAKTLRRAVRRLGWQPKHGGFLDDAETYYEAWKASKG